MKMIPECTRDILFLVEEKSTIDQPCYISPSAIKHYEKLSKYDVDTILYHVRICLMSDLVFIPQEFKNSASQYSYHIDLTPKGHEFLANVRSDTVWNKTIDIAGKVGSYSLDIISKIAASVLSELIKQYIGQPLIS